MFYLFFFFLMYREFSVLAVGGKDKDPVSPAP